MNSGALLLAIDVGNTQTVIGLFDGQEKKASWSLGSVASRSSDDLAALVQGLFRLDGYQMADVGRVVLSSVVPPLGPTLETMVKRCFGVDPLVVGPGTKTGIVIKYDNPHEVGADRVVNAVAGFHYFGGPLIVVDFGTAWLMLTVPVDFHIWQYWSSSLDSCTSEYVYTGEDVYFYEMTNPSFLELTSGSSTIRMNNGFKGYNGYFVNENLTSGDFRQNSTYDLEEVISDEMPVFEIPNGVPTPLAPSFTSPAIHGTSLPAVSSSQVTFVWTGADGADWLGLQLYRYNSDQSVLLETLSCAAYNDGSFSVPSAAWSSWGANQLVLVVAGALAESTAVLPWDNSDFRVVGEYYTVGGFSTR